MNPITREHLTTDPPCVSRTNIFRCNANRKRLHGNWDKYTPNLRISAHKSPPSKYVSKWPCVAQHFSRYLGRGEISTNLAVLQSNLPSIMKLLCCTIRSMYEASYGATPIWWCTVPWPG